MIRITIEGPIASGKSTISNHLLQSLARYLSSATHTENGWLWETVDNSPIIGPIEVHEVCSTPPPSSTK